MSRSLKNQKEVKKGRKWESTVLGWTGQPTRTIDCYDILEQVGEGTYGQVFKGRDKVTKEIVALKKIRFYSKAQGLPLTSLREIKILKQLKHENMVCLKEIVTSVGSREWKTGASRNVNGGTVAEEERRGDIYLVLEYVEHDLAGLLDTAFLFPIPAVKFVVKQLLKVLSHMHEHAYLHRDIKCSNLLINNNYGLKVADFGLARRLSLRSSGEGSSAEDALTNKVITLWYRPPELLLGSRQYGPAVDLWGVGCIMAELLTGRPTFHGKNEMEQVNMIFKVCGTPNEKSWPNHKNLAYYEKMLPSVSYPDVLDSHLRTMAKKRPMVMGEHWDDYMTREAIQLIKRLLTLDPRRRCTAAAALSAGWFVTKPACPKHATDLSPLNTNGESFHEWRTKKERKKMAALMQQKEAAISTSSARSPEVAGSGPQQHIDPPPPAPPCSTSISSSSSSLISPKNSSRNEVVGGVDKTRIIEKRREELQKWYKQKQLDSSSTSGRAEEKDHGNRMLPSSTDDRRGGSSLRTTRTDYSESYAFAAPPDSGGYAQNRLPVHDSAAAAEEEGEEEARRSQGNSTPRRQRVTTVDSKGRGGCYEGMVGESSGVDRAVAHNNRHREEHQSGGGDGHLFDTSRNDDDHHHNQRRYDNNDKYVQREWIKDCKRPPLHHRGGGMGGGGYSKGQRWDQKYPRRSNSHHTLERNHCREKYEYDSRDYANQAMSSPTRHHHSSRRTKR